MSEPNQPQPQSDSEESNVELAQIQQIAAAEISDASPDTSTSQDVYTIEKLALEVGGIRQQLSEAKEIQAKRLEYLDKLYALIRNWLIVTVLFVGVSAAFPTYFSLSENVLIAFITSTTVTVLGLFGVAARWLFPDLKRPGDTKKD